MKSKIFAILSIPAVFAFLLTIGYLSTEDFERPEPTTELATVLQQEITGQTTEPETLKPFEPFPVPLDVNIQWYINAQCEVKGIPTTLVLALIWQESRFQADVISATEDFGLMQVNACNKAEVKRVLNVTDLLEPYQNIKAGLYILDKALEAADGDYNRALMVYNLGLSGAKAQWQKGVYSTPYSRSVLVKMAELEAAL